MFSKVPVVAFSSCGLLGFCGASQGLLCGFQGSNYPKGPCTQIVYTLRPMYPCRDYFKANVYTV